MQTKKALAHTKKIKHPPPLKPNIEQKQPKKRKKNPKIHSQAKPHEFFFHRGAASGGI